MLIKNLNTNIFRPSVSTNYQILGVIIVDDILWKGEVLNPQDRRAKVLDDFNKYINSREDVDNLILPIRHGVNIIKKRISNHISSK